MLGGMRTAFDTRPWNLLVGLALATTACGGGPIAVDEGGTTTSMSSTSESTSADETTRESTSADETTSESTSADETTGDCRDSEDCEWLDALPSCGDPIAEPSLPVQLGIPEFSVALGFADADDDGAEELIVVSTTDIYTLEFAAPTTSRSRELETESVEGIATGDFDLDPGEDLAVLVDDTLRIYSSDGLGSFGPGSARPSPVTGSAGLRAGDLDGAGPDDLLVHGSGGVAIDRVDAPSIPITDTPTIAATSRASGSADPGLALHGASHIARFDLDGGAGGVSPISEDPDAVAGPLSSGTFAGVLHDVSAALVAGGTTLQLWRPDEPEPVFGWGMDATVNDLLAADFDGDGSDELVLQTLDGVWLVRDLLGDPCVVAFEFPGGNFTPERLAAGDYDGDGDDELALDGNGWMFVFDLDSP